MWDVHLLFLFYLFFIYSSSINGAAKTVDGHWGERRKTFSK
jgi:hypothetical protein